MSAALKTPKAFTMFSFNASCEDNLYNGLTKIVADWSKIFGATTDAYNGDIREWGVRQETRIKYDEITIQGIYYDANVGIEAVCGLEFLSDFNYVLICWAWWENDCCGFVELAPVYDTHLVQKPSHFVQTRVEAPLKSKLGTYMLKYLQKNYYKYMERVLDEFGENFGHNIVNIVLGYLVNETIQNKFNAMIWVELERLKLEGECLIEYLLDCDDNFENNADNVAKCVVQCVQGTM